VLLEGRNAPSSTAAAGRSSGEPPRDYYLGGLQVAFEAIESMRRQLSSELGRHGVRFVTLPTGGVPETIPAAMEGASRSWPRSSG
jgi:hypothetical protein